MASPAPSNAKETCPVCHDDVEIYAIGCCDHTICFKCSTRMRVLCEQMYCVICRKDLSQVLFMRQAKSYKDNVDKCKLFWQKKNIYFENERIQNAFLELISHKCKLCSYLKPMKTFHELEQHMRREHNQHYCDICVRNLKIFSAERKSYDREKLARHRRLGDIDDTSLKGHPLCELCDQRYLDRDELARHCRKEHFHCHFCETDGRSLEFFSDYAVLKDHFHDEHYLCEEDDCIHARFTNAFRSEIDLKAHKATSHSRSMRKAEARQARVIEVDFQLAPRSNYGRGRGRGRHRDRDYDKGRDDINIDSSDREQRRNEARQRRDEYRNAQAVALALNEIHRQSGSIATVDRAILDPKSLEQVRQENFTSNANFKKKTEDFPTLDGKNKGKTNDSDDERKLNSDKDTLAKKVARASNFSVQDGSMEEQDFPSLGGHGRGKKTHTSYKSAWQVQPESSDFPAMVSSQKAMKITKSGANKTTKAAPVVKSNNWVQQVQKPTASIKHTITSDLSGGRVNSAPKLPSQSTKATPSPAPSLSSIGNSLLNFTPNAPGLSLTRSSSAAALVPPSWSEVGHSQGTGKNYTERREPPPNFITDDFPSLGGNTDHAQSNQWISKGKQSFKSKNDDSKASKKFKGKQPAPMPDFMQPAEPEPKPNEFEMKPPTKPTSKSDQWETPKPQKSFRGVREEKHVKEQETAAGQKTQNKQTKGKKNGGKKPSKDVSDKESDHAETKPKPTTSTATKDNKYTAAKNNVAKYNVKPPRQSEQKPTVNEHMKNSNVDPPFELKKNVQHNKTNPPKKTKEDVTNYKVDSPKESRKDNKSHKVDSSKKSKMDVVSDKIDLRKESKQDIASYKVDPPRVSMKIVVKPPDPQPVSSEKRAVDSKVDNFPSLSDLSQSSSNIQSLSLNSEEFPALRSINKSTPALGSMSTNPPPGFASAVDKTTSRPPPGFMNPVTSTATSKPPPGFNTHDVENVAPQINGSMLPQYNYVQPSNFKLRNQQLISDIQGMLSMEQFARFKSCSGEFRQDQISASEYYSKCSNIMGADRFTKIFPQLLSLLPDISKQQDLLSAHTTLEDRAKDIIAMSQSGKRGWNSNVSLFTTCTTCRQVVIQTDLSTHMTQHSVDTDFPTLSSIGASLGTWAKK